jgi:hypothetical protein
VHLGERVTTLQGRARSASEFEGRLTVGEGAQPGEQLTFLRRFGLTEQCEQQLGVWNPEPPKAAVPMGSCFDAAPPELKSCLSAPADAGVGNAEECLRR